MQKITPFLWFDDQAEAAVNFYTSLFADSKVTKVSRYTEEGPGPTGSVMLVNFELQGQEFMALNGGPEYQFTEAMSLFVNCESQAEVDRLWDALTDGGEEGPCGWLKDRYGVSWQIVPTVLGQLMADDDPEKVRAVTAAMFLMKKLDLQALQDAYDQA